MASLYSKDAVSNLILLDELSEVKITGNIEFATLSSLKTNALYVLSDTCACVFVFLCVCVVFLRE
jgi:hypothetical protein